MRFLIFLRVLTAILCSTTLLTEAAVVQKVYVANFGGSGTVSVINTATDTAPNVPISVNISDAPFALAVTPDGTKVYVANFGGAGTVSVIDTATDTATLISVNIGDGPIALVIATFNLTGLIQSVVKYAPMRVFRGVHFKSN
ncbi:hypothetical protein COB11_01510 [Candidatus Aerophobetes bacterium]|uniref:YncE family protein n=1 Tax=Aerophobetes bacterium TaxID=2030807 RepID=A0A2A4YMZ2_UNCAE|nr:MAG: hypothetical protein COB11_01510 [Candidatus Aerophobetes bacterium]